MALGTQVQNPRMFPYSRSKRKTLIALSSQDSLAELKRDRSAFPTVRPYVRTSTLKLRWTRELHESFLRAVKTLGGKDVATPKQILQLMDRDDITLAHIKSHLQMYRTGKINAKGMPVNARYPVQFKPISKQLSPEQVEKLQQEAREVHMALQLLKEGRVSGASGETQLKTVADIQAFKRFMEMASQEKKTTETASQERKTMDLIPAIDSPTSRSESAKIEEVETMDLIPIAKEVEDIKLDEVELNLSMAPSTPKMSPTLVQFPCASTAEEATLSLGLSV